MGHVCSRQENYKLEFPVDMEVLGDYNVFDEFPLVVGVDTLSEDLLKKGSSFRAKPLKRRTLKRQQRLELENLKSLDTPSSMPSLMSARWGVVCEDSDSKSVFSDCLDSDSKSAVSEDFHSLTYESSEELEKPTTKYDMTNWVWKPEEDRISRTGTYTCTPHDSPPGMPRLSRRSGGPGQQFPSNYF